MNRRHFMLALAAAVAAPGLAVAQSMPSADTIMRRLDAAPARAMPPRERVDAREFKRRPDLRGAAPSINIQSINFAFASAEIPRSAKASSLARIACCSAMPTETTDGGSNEI